MRRAREGAALLVEGLIADASRLDLLRLAPQLAGLTAPARSEVAWTAVEAVHLRMNAGNRAMVVAVDGAGVEFGEGAHATLGRWFPNASLVTAEGSSAAAGVAQTSDRYVGANSAPSIVDIERLEERLVGAPGGLAGLAVRIGLTERLTQRSMWSRWCGTWAT